MSFVMLLVFVFNSGYGKNLGYHHHKHNNNNNINGGYNYEPPEITNNDPPQFGAYQYPIPNPPLFDETTANPHPPYVNYGPPTLDLPNPNVTLPPLQNDIPDYPGYLPPQPPQYKPPEDDYPNNQYIPPLKDDYPNNQYIPPLKDDYPNNQYLPPTSPYETPSVISSRIRVSNMSCLDSPVGGYFRAFMTLSRSITSLPVVDDAPGDCITGTGDLFRLELEGDRIKQCGVRFCSNGLNMCVSVRMPTVRGLKLPEDGLMTLRCRPQERVVAHTKQIRMNTQNIVQQARSALSSGATIVSGGSQRQFDSQVALFRRGTGGNGGAAGRTAGTVGGNGAPGNGDFTQLVGVGTPVTLGEELMLRAAVREGDGWRFSRLGDVTVHHVSNGGRTVRQRAVTLLDSAGCRDARTRAICPTDPVQPSPLITTFGVRAFMFQGMQSGDEMLMSVRIIACLNYEDCHSKSRSCSESQPVGRSNRLRREINDSMTTTTSDYQSYLEFRVVNPGVSTPDADNNDVEHNSDARTPHKSNTFSVAAVVIVISSCLVLGAAGGLIISCARN